MRLRAVCKVFLIGSLQWANGCRPVTFATRPRRSPVFTYYVDGDRRTHFHGLLQPLCGSRFDLREWDKVAMADGAGWITCPLYARAMAHPDDITRFELHTPPHDAKATVRALEGLLVDGLDRAFLRGDSAFMDDSLLTAMYVVALCEEPQATAPQPATDPALARLLLKAVEGAFVDVLEDVKLVEDIAKGLGMDISEVYGAHPFMPSPRHDGRVRTTMLTETSSRR